MEVTLGSETVKFEPAQTILPLSKKPAEPYGKCLGALCASCACCFELFCLGKQNTWALRGFFFHRLVVGRAPRLFFSQVWLLGARSEAFFSQVWLLGARSEAFFSGFMCKLRVLF